jgi:DNA-binding MurR/RpiR family transcriptional regulator
MTPDIPAQPVQNRIAEAYRELPEAMRRIADALMSDPLLGALWGIEVMSEKAEVSVGTVVRFAKRLGYKGFSEFRDALRAACHARSGDAELELMEVPSADVVGTLAEVTRRDGETLQRLIQAVDHDTLTAATRMLIEAHHRVILGRGVSHVMSLVLGFYLTQAGLPCIAAIPSDFSTQVANLGPKDLLVVLSFFPYSRESVDSAMFAKECGIPVLAFADRTDSPLKSCADILIPVPSEDLLFSFSITTFAALAHAFAIVVASEDHAGTLKRLKAADKVAQPLLVDHWLPMHPGAFSFDSRLPKR